MTVEIAISREYHRPSKGGAMRQVVIHTTGLDGKIQSATKHLTEDKYQALLVRLANALQLEQTEGDDK